MLLFLETIFMREKNACTVKCKFLLFSDISNFPWKQEAVNTVQNLKANNIKTIHCCQFNIQKSEEWQLPTFRICYRKWAEIEHNTFFKVKVLVPQLCPTLCSPTDCSSPSSSVQGITRVGSHSFFEGIFPNQGSNPGSHALQAESLPSEPLGEPKRRF